MRAVLHQGLQGLGGEAQQAPFHIGILDEERPQRRKDSARPAQDQLPLGGPRAGPGDEGEAVCGGGQGDLRGEGRSIEGHDNVAAQEGGSTLARGYSVPRGG